MGDTVFPEPVIPASLLQSFETGLATIASPAALVAAIAPIQPSGAAPASDPPMPAAPTPAPAPAAITAFDETVAKTAVNVNMGVREPNNEGAGEEAGPPVGCIDMSTVTVKPEP